jgi:hypothetical protein
MYYSQEELKERFPYHGRSDTFSDIIGRIVRGLSLNDVEWDKVTEYIVELYDRQKLAAHKFLKEKHPLMDETTIKEMAQIFINSMPMSSFDTESDLYDEKFIEEYYREKEMTATKEKEKTYDLTMPLYKQIGIDESVALPYQQCLNGFLIWESYKPNRAERF